MNWGHKRKPLKSNGSENCGFGQLVNSPSLESISLLYGSSGKNQFMSTKNQQIDVELNEYVEEVDRTFNFLSCHETLEAKWTGPNFKATIQHSVLKCWLPFLFSTKPSHISGNWLRNSPADHVFAFSEGSRFRFPTLALGERG